MTLKSLRNILVGAKVTRLEGTDWPDGPHLRAIAFSDGTILRFNWPSGAGEEVGLRVGRAREGPTIKSTARF